MQYCTAIYQNNNLEFTLYSYFLQFPSYSILYNSKFHIPQFFQITPLQESVLILCSIALLTYISVVKKTKRDRNINSE